MTMKRIIVLKSKSGHAWPIPDGLESKTEGNCPANNLKLNKSRTENKLETIRRIIGQTSPKSSGFWDQQKTVEKLSKDCRKTVRRKNFSIFFKISQP
jgi:hypothetical protein